MTLKELMALQEKFDERHAGNFEWSKKISDDNIEMLEFLLVCLTGEVGETANIVKKVVRGDFCLGECRKHLTEEIADVFAYLLKLCYQLDIDLETAYLEKMKQNQERFRSYEFDKKYDGS